MNSHVHQLALMKSGPDSAWKSVIDARQTLRTALAMTCGDDLVDYTRAFIDGLDFAVVRDVPALERAAAGFLTERPLPSCLPRVPAWDRGPTP